MNIFNKAKDRTIIIVSGVIFLIIAVGLKGNVMNSSSNSLMSFSTFLFGIFVAFAIANAHNKIRKVNEAIKTEEGNILFIYKSLGLWKEEIKHQAQELIDKYLIDQIDYYLKDFKYSSKSFMKIFDFILYIDCHNETQKIVYGSMISVLSDSLNNRKQVEALVSERMAVIEWLSVILLLLVNIIYIFNMNDGSIMNVVSSMLLSITSVIFVLILSRLDTLNWKEQNWIWEPLENLFKELDLIPYYPKSVIKTGRAKTIKGQRIRIVEYSNKYPNMEGKIVNEIQV